jgi:hypothetical protein
VNIKKHETTINKPSAKPKYAIKLSPKPVLNTPLHNKKKIKLPLNKVQTKIQ